MRKCVNTEGFLLDSFTSEDVEHDHVCALRNIIYSEVSLILALRCGMLKLLLVLKSSDSNYTFLLLVL